MASVVICPHCYLQLFVPDSIEEDAHVGCPACREPFGLGEALPRALPEVVRVDSAALQTTASPASRAATLEAAAPRRPGDRDPNLTVDLLKTRVFPSATAAPKVEREVNEVVPPKASAVTLADLMTPDSERGDAIAESPIELSDSGKDATIPSFDLPDVPLSNEAEPTMDLTVDLPTHAAASSDFEFGDLQLDLPGVDDDGEKTVRESGDSTVEMREGVEPAIDTTAPRGSPENEDGKSSIPGGRSPEAGRPVAPVGGRKASPAIAPIVGRRRRRSVLVTLAGFAIFSLGGLAAGYYVLLYLLGPTGDFLGVAQHLPSVALPASFADPQQELAAASNSAAPALSAGVERGAGSGSRALPAGFDEPVQLPTELAADESDDVADDEADTKPVVANREYGADRATLDDRTGESYRAEPARFEEETVAQPAAATPGLVGGPTYSLDQLAAILDEAQAAQPGLLEGDLSDAAVRRTKGRSYSKLCDLAEAWTYCDGTTAPRYDEIQREVESLFHATLADDHVRQEVARIVTIWIDSPSRRHGGVFLAGTASGGQIAGDVYEYQLESAFGDSLVIISPQPLDRDAAAATTIGVVGTIVDGPAEKIAGYVGDARQAIWVRNAFPLE